MFRRCRAALSFAFIALLMTVPGRAQDTGEFLITDHGAKGDNAFDNAPVINGLIAKFGASGGTILIPAGDFRIHSPVVVNKSFITIRGVNYGQRSNVDPLSGVFAPAGGSKLILGAGVLQGAAWPADPRGRDGLYGLVKITGNDNVCAANTVMSWQPAGDARVHVAAGDRNVLRNLTIGANASGRRIFIHGTLTTATRITHCGVAAEIDLSGSPTARVEYDP